MLLSDAIMSEQCCCRTVVYEPQAKFMPIFLLVFVLLPVLWELTRHFRPLKVILMHHTFLLSELGQMSLSVII